MPIPPSNTSFLRKSQQTARYPVPHVPVSRRTITLFFLICAYTAVPVIDVPLLGLSLSAPLFFFVALEVFLRPSRVWMRRCRGWILLAAVIWLGIFASIIGNALSSETGSFDSTPLVQTARYTYWILVFVAAAYLTAAAQLGHRIVNLLSLAVTGAALLRWLEVFTLHNIGAWTGTEFMTQNSYGIMFSTYAPFTLGGIINETGRRRRVAILSALLIWGAAAINGSRSSWICISLGVLLFILLNLIAQPRRISVLLWFAILGAMLPIAWSIAPEEVVTKVNERYATFQSLDEDKSYQIRRLMAQKGVRLFGENPLLGVGPGRFRSSSTELDIPRVLQYASQSHFDVKSAHNSYILFLAETGLAGVIPYGVLLLSLLLLGGKASVQLAHQGNYWAIALFVSFITMSIHLWSLAGLTNTGPWLIYGLVAGMIVASKYPQYSQVLHQKFSLEFVQQDDKGIPSKQNTSAALPQLSAQNRRRKSNEVNKIWH